MPDSIREVVEGVSEFQRRAYPERKELFSALAKGQDPKVLFLTCADSRVDPTRVTQSPPGRLFVFRNLGNIVPPESASDDSVTATIEFVTGVVHVEDIIICGHSDCGAMRALLAPTNPKTPAISAWLRYAEAARNSADTNREGDRLLRAVTEQNIILQLENLATYPAIVARVASGELALHGWLYDIGSGAVDMYDAGARRFVPLRDTDHSTAAG